MNHDFRGMAKAFRKDPGESEFAAGYTAAIKDFEALPVRRTTQTTVVMERAPLDAWRLGRAR